MSWEDDPVAQPWEADELVPPGPAQPGIDRSRPLLNNADGSFSTERTITVEADGRHHLIPTIVGGKQLSEDDAIKAWEAGTNKSVGTYGSAQEADAAARARSQQIGQVRGPDRLGVGDRLGLMAGDTTLPALAGGVARGVGGTANYLADLVNRGTNSLGLTQTPAESLPSARYNRFLEQMGLGQGEGAANQLGGAVGQGVGMTLDPTATMGMAGAPARSRLPAQPTPRQLARENAFASKRVMTPTEVPGTPGGNIFEALSFPSKLREEASSLNQDITNAAMQRETGLRASDMTPKGLTDRIGDIWHTTVKPISDANVPVPQTGFALLPDLRTIANGTAGNPQSPLYRKDVAKEIYKTATSYRTSTLLDTIRDARKEGRKLLDAAQPDTRMGNAMLQVADLLETKLEAAVSPQVFQAWKAGQRDMAVAAAIRDKGLIHPTGNVDAPALARVLEQQKMLTGAPYQAGEFSANFPRLSQVPKRGEQELIDRIQPGMGVSQIGAIFQAAGAPMRGAIKSKGYQATMRNPGLLDFEKRGLFATPGALYQNTQEQDLWSAPE